jgi:hypothetical protein
VSLEFNNGKSQHLRRSCRLFAIPEHSSLQQSTHRVPIYRNCRRTTSVLDRKGGFAINLDKVTNRSNSKELALCCRAERICPSEHCCSRWKGVNGGSGINIGFVYFGLFGSAKHNRIGSAPVWIRYLRRPTRFERWAWQIKWERHAGRRHFFKNWLGNTQRSQLPLQNAFQ